MLHGRVWRLLAVPFLTAVGLAQQTITFQFNPPDGTAFVERDRKIMRVVVSGEQPSEQTSETKYKYLIRKTPEGYSVRMEPGDPEFKLSSDLQALARSMLSNTVITADLDQRGRLVRIRGANTALAKAKQILPKELYDVVMQQLGGKTAEQIVAQSWNDRAMLGALTGVSMQIGAVEKLHAPLPLPTQGTIDADITLAAKSLRPCHARQCVLLKFTQDSDDPRLASTFNGLVLGSMLGLVAAMVPPTAKGQAAKADATSEVKELLSKIQYSDLRYSLVDERLVDPATGLLYSERETKTTEGVLHLDQEQRKMTSTEIHEYNFTYQ